MAKRIYQLQWKSNSNNSRIHFYLVDDGVAVLIVVVVSVAGGSVATSFVATRFGFIVISMANIHHDLHSDELILLR